MSKAFGEFIEEFPLEHESLELSFTSSPLTIKKRWRNNRLSAHFVADYFSTFLQADRENSQEESRLEANQSAVSYIGNELLENAIKFNEDKHYQVKLGIHFLEDADQVTVVIFTKNSLTTQRADKFQAFIQKLLSTDSQELYIQQIEKTAADDHSEASGLGLLTIINDYSAKLGWKFESDPSHPTIAVTTMVQFVV